MSRARNCDESEGMERVAPDRPAEAVLKPVPKDPVPLEKRPQPGSLPAADDRPRVVGERAARDLESDREDPYQAGRDAQRREAPADSPTCRGSAD